MGNSLDTPTTEKESACCAATGNLRLAWASSCMQGWRKGMEDAHITMPSFNEGSGPGADVWRGLGLFGVFDGHGGEQVAKFCHRHLAEELCKFPVDRHQGYNREDLRKAFVGSFHRLDDMLREPRYLDELNKLANLAANTSERSMRPGEPGGRPNPADMGCTACVCCITPQEILVANAGDSRAVLSRSGKAVPLSFDHKPNDPIETQRILNAGGKVQNMGQGVFRVNGNLNLSRAIGDLKFKQGRLKPEEQMICSTPDVLFQDRSDDDEFVVVCCDGVWDMMTNQEVVDFVRHRLPKGREVLPKDLERIMEALLDKCLSPDLRKTNGLGGDNMTAVVVLFEKEALPRLASVQEGPKSDTGGQLLVTVDLPKGCTMNELFVHVPEAGPRLHVGLTHRPVSEGGRGCPSTWIDLASHLPSGAAFVLDDAGAKAAVSAEFHKKQAQLKVLLPWRLAQP